MNNEVKFHWCVCLFTGNNDPPKIQWNLFQHKGTHQESYKSNPKAKLEEFRIIPVKENSKILVNQLKAYVLIHVQATEICLWIRERNNSLVNFQFIIAQN